MDLFDKLRDPGRHRLGIELGSEVSVVEVRDDGELTIAVRAVWDGAVAGELGGWLRRWLDSLGVQVRAVHAVLADGEIQHHLLTLPEMSETERNLAVAAELRRLSSAPVQQIAYSQMPAGDVEKAGLSKQRVLVAVVDRSTVRNAEAAVEEAGLELASLQTVLPVVIEVARRNEDLSGSVALTWLSSDRGHVAVLRDGVVELVRDFRLRGAADAEDALDLLASELRRSFLFFTQSVPGDHVERLRLSGPLDGIERLLTPLSAALDLDVALLSTGAVVGETHDLSEVDLAGLVAAIGAGAVPVGGGSTIRSPEAAAGARVERWMSIGNVAAAIVLVLLVGWGTLAWLDARVTQQRAERAQARLSEVAAELGDARRTAQARAADTARRAVLEDRALESSLLGSFLQLVSRSIDEPVVLERLRLTSRAGPAGQTYWDAQLEGLVLGASRSESQSIFSRFYSRLADSAIVDSVHLVEPLVIGFEDARQDSRLGEAPLPEPARSREDAERGRLAPDRAESGTTRDDPAPLSPTATSVGFRIAVELKSIETGASR